MDTIRLKIKYRLTDTDNLKYFQEKKLAKDLDWQYLQGSRYILTNETWRKEEQKKGRYMPLYWLEEDYIWGAKKTYFCLQVSLPKAIGGENVITTVDDKWEQVLSYTAAFCRELGLHIFEPQIKKAMPTLVAVGKNLTLESRWYCDTVLRALSPFNFKPHAQFRGVDFSDYKNGGKEIIFSLKHETFKHYDKKREVINTARTARERELAGRWRQRDFVLEMLRVELTLKMSRAPQRHDSTDGRARRLHFAVSRPCRISLTKRQE